MTTVSDKDGPDQDLPDEPQLDEYLRGGSAVSRQYRELASADVPAEIDRLVLRQAQEAVKARPAKSRAWMRWTGPLALAASAVLVVSIVIESGVHKETYVAAPVSAPLETQLLEEAAEQPTASNAAEKRAYGARDQAGSAREASAVQVVPVQTPMKLATPPAILVPEEPALALDQTSAIQSAAPAAPAPQFASPPPVVAVDEASEQLARRDMAPEEAVVTARKRQEQKPTVGPRNTIAAPAAAAKSESGAAAERDEPRNYSDPEQWLRDIRQLRQENKQEQADREWRRFRYVFPNYRVAETDAARGVPR